MLEQLSLSKFLSSSNRVYLLMALATILRFALTPFSQTVDADAVSRVFMSWVWMEDMEFIAQGVWLPFHQYLLGIGFALFPDMVITPKLINTLLFVLAVWPFYKFCASVFHEDKAWLPTLLLIISPAILRNGLMAMAGVPYISFVIWAVYFAQKTVETSRLKHAVLAGLFITIAAGFRYEAWVISGLLFWMMALQGQRKTLISYTIIAASYPAVWMLGNYLIQGDAMHGLSGAYDWNVVRAGVNEHMSMTEHLRRVLFFPISLGLNMGYFLGLLTAIVLISRAFQRKLTKAQWLWLIPFFFILVTYIVKGNDGTLLLKHRFTITLLVFFIPYSALLVTANAKLKNGVLLLLTILILPLTGFMVKANIHYLFFAPTPLREAVYQVRDIGLTTAQPIPRLIGKRAQNVLGAVEENMKPNDGLILDFFGWDDTYYVALHATHHAGAVFLQNGAINDEPAWDRISVFLNELLPTNREGVLILNPKSNFGKTLRNERITLPNEEGFLALNKIAETDGLTIYRYKFGKQQLSAFLQNEF
jgi:hypothetical protein